MDFLIDVKNIPGTNCYMDPAAGDEIRKIISPIPLKSVHFIGSGNYHYISYLFLERITKDFNLLVFDNHPDTKEPAFGGILSCGSWVRQSLSDFCHLKNVYICGAASSHIAEESPLPDKAYTVDINELPRIIPNDLPLYISIDKDVLSEEFAATDWDQGEMTLPELLGAIESFGSYEILGIDICGDKKSEPNGSEIELNERTNSALLVKCSPLTKGGV